MKHVAPGVERRARVGEPEIVPDQNERVTVRHALRRSPGRFQQRRRGAVHQVGA